MNLNFLSFIKTLHQGPERHEFLFGMSQACDKQLRGCHLTSMVSEENGVSFHAEAQRGGTSAEQWRNRTYGNDANKIS